MNVRDSDKHTRGVSGDKVLVLQIFDLRCMLTNKYEEDQNIITFEKVRYSKKCSFTLLSIPVIMKKGFTLHGGDSWGIMLQKGDLKIVFDIPACMDNGVIWCIGIKRLNPSTDREAETLLAQLEYNITTAHALFGHMHEDAVRKSCKHLNIKLL